MRIGNRAVLAALCGTFLLAFPSRGRAQGEGSAAPKLVVAAPRKDAGSVVRGETVRAVFTVRNEGTADLHVKEVRPSCGCTATQFDPLVLAGGQGSVTLSVDTKALSGAVNKTAVVVTDDPVTPQATLTVSAVVTVPVAVLPTGYLRVETLAGRGGSASQVLASDDRAFHPHGAETEVAWMSASITPVPEAERLAGRGAIQQRLTLTVAQEAPEGLLGGTVKVRTGLARPPVLEVPVAGFVRPSVSLSASSLDFRNFFPGSDPVRRFVVLTGNDESSPLSVLSATVSVKGLSVKSASLDPHRVEVTLTVEPSIPKGAFEGELLLRTTDRLRPVIRVPVKGVVLVREK